MGHHDSSTGRRRPALPALLSLAILTMAGGTAGIVHFAPRYYEQSFLPPDRVLLLRARVVEMNQDDHTVRYCVTVGRRSAERYGKLLPSETDFVREKDKVAAWVSPERPAISQTARPSSPVSSGCSSRAAQLTKCCISCGKAEEDSRHTSAEHPTGAWAEVSPRSRA